MRANDLFDAFEALDGEMVYAAHADSKARRQKPRRMAIAAAIVLLTVSAFVIYGMFLAPSAAVHLASREDVTVTLNSRGNVLSASGYPGQDGRSAEKAVAAITREMLTSGTLDETENTLILGAEKLTDEAQAKLFDTVREEFSESRFHGAIVCLPCTESGAKAAVIRLLTGSDNGFTADSLRAMSANDLNLLLHEYKTDGATLYGEPSESGYIGKDAAVRRAEKNTGLKDATISVSYTVYSFRLVYLVQVIGGELAEAYFINAFDGTIETALRTTPEQLTEEIRTAVTESNTPKEETPEAQDPVTDTRAASVTEAGTTASGEPGQENRTITDGAAPTDGTPISDETPNKGITTVDTPIERDPAKDITSDKLQETIMVGAAPDDETTKPTTVPGSRTVMPTSVPPIAPIATSAAFAPTESRYVPTPTELPTSVSTEKPTENNQTTLLVESIPYAEVICTDRAFGKEIQFKQLSSGDNVTKSDGNTEQEKEKNTMQDNQLAMIKTWRDLAYYEALAVDDGNEALIGFLEEIESKISPDNIFFRDYGLVIAVCYHDDYLYSVNPTVESIQLSGITAYVSIRCTYPATNFNNHTPLLHTSFVAANVNKKDLEDIESLKLVFTKAK